MKILVGTEGGGKRGIEKFIFFLKNSNINIVNISSGKDCSIIFRAKWPNEEKFWNDSPKKYVYWSGESYPPPKSEFETKSLYIISHIDNNINSIYLPYCLYSNHIYKERKYKNSNRPYLLAYCHKNKVNEREKFFNLFVKKSKVNLCHSLSNCCGDYPDTIINSGIDKAWHSQKLIDTYKNYKFVMAMENKIIDGYITEKIINAFYSGAIPIFWGSSNVKDFFNKKAFIDVSDFNSFEDCIDYCLSLSEKEIIKMQNEPIYTNNDLINIFNSNFKRNKTNKNTVFNNYSKKIKDFISD